jgi:hypothetical protein
MSYLFMSSSDICRPETREARSMRVCVNAFLSPWLALLLSSFRISTLLV